MMNRAASQPTWMIPFAGVVLGACVMTACSSDALHHGDKATDAPRTVPPAERLKRIADSLQLPPVTPPEQGNVGAAVPQLYDPAKIVQVELTLDDAAIAMLSSAEVAAAKTWAHAKFKCGDVTFDDVGVRVKGTSTLRLYPGKAALKVKLNKWVKGQKLAGIDTLTLNNMMSDPTFLAERITYHVFRSLGLHAPHANAAHVTINGQDYGLYANIETPNESFLARELGGKGASLYEVNWGSSWLPGDGGETGFEIDVPVPGALPGTMPDVDQLFQAVAAARDEKLLDDLAGHLHTKMWLRHSAAEAVTGHYDGYAYGLYGSHNYFMIGDVDGKFELAPWSTDLSLSNREGVPDAANPLGTTVFARCKRSTTCWDTYKAEVKSVLDVYETLDLVNLAKSWHQQIDTLARSDPKRESGIDDYESVTEHLYEFLATRPSVVRAQLGL